MWNIYVWNCNNLKCFEKYVDFGPLLQILQGTYGGLQVPKSFVAP